MSTFELTFRKFHSEIVECSAKIDFQQMNLMLGLTREAIDVGGRIYLAGNGGSSSIVSHVTVDLLKSCGVRAVNFNEHNLITCYANDFGYDQWVVEALNSYVDVHDALILISSSGESDNIVNAAKTAREMGVKTITFSGFHPDNRLRALGDLNFWCPSENYNVVETVHQLWLLSWVEDLRNAKINPDKATK